MKALIINTLIALASYSTAFPTASPGPNISALETHQLFRRESCGPNFLCTITDANNIVNHFVSQDTQMITTPTGGQYQSIYQSGACYLIVHAINADSAAPYSRDVGYGLRNLISKCHTLSGLTGGNGAAGGNGNFGLTLVGSSG